MRRYVFILAGRPHFIRGMLKAMIARHGGQTEVCRLGGGQ